jgi:hypothetical protein
MIGCANDTDLCAGYSIPEESPASQTFNLASRLGLDSCLGLGLEHPTLIRQQLEGGPRSLSTGGISRTDPALIRMALSQPMVSSYGQFSLQEVQNTSFDLPTTSSIPNPAIKPMGPPAKTAPTSGGQEAVKGMRMHIFLPRCMAQA